jgi:hypothetical protein
MQVGPPPFAAYVPHTGYFDFHRACKHHDGCYEFRWADRATCDAWFLNDTRASCDALHSNQACYAAARLYYRGVRIFRAVPWELHDIKSAGSAARRPGSRGSSKPSWSSSSLPPAEINPQPSPGPSSP